MAPRDLLAASTWIAPSLDVTPHAGEVHRRAREALLGQRAATVWLTGLPGSGKSTLALGVEKRLIEQGCACYVLDGDSVRQGLTRDLGFSPRDRHENIRRVAAVAALMNDAGLVVITALISPYRCDRRIAREIVGRERFLEVFIDAPVDVCERRDPKGLYRRARAGQIPQFTGVSAPYEAPEQPDLALPTAELDIDESQRRLLDFTLAAIHRESILQR